MSQVSESIIKEWALVFSDTLSTQLKVNVHLGSCELSEKLYQDVLSERNAFQWVTIGEHLPEKDGFIFAIKPQTIKNTSQVFFGGEAQESDEHNDKFTFSEIFIGNQCSNICIDAFSDLSKKTQMVRIERNLSLAHLFHHEQMIQYFNMSWLINDHPAGDCCLCYSTIM